MGYPVRLYRETGIEGFGSHPCGGLFASHKNIYMKKQYWVLLIFLTIPLVSYASINANPNYGITDSTVGSSPIDSGMPPVATFSLPNIQQNTASNTMTGEIIIGFILAILGIPFVLVYLIAIIAKGNKKFALKCASITILVELLIGFVILLISA